MKRLALALALLACTLVPSSAWAHAQLISTSPARNAVLRTQPERVTFTFGEAVGGTAGAVRVYDSSGTRVDQGDADHPRGNLDAFGVALNPRLARGTYTATYRIVSADSHVVTGGFTFSIGAASMGGGASLGKLLAGQKAGALTSDAFTVARAVQYAAIAIAVGVLAFLALVWRAELPRARTMIRFAAGAGFVSAVLALGLEGAEVAAVSFWNGYGHLGDVLATRFGVVWTITAALWLAIGLSRRLSFLAVGLVIVPALSGHASVEHPVWLYLPSNVIHVTAMSVWLGGLAAYVFAVRPLGVSTPVLARTLARFSPLALGCVTALLATGVVQSLLEIDAWAELLHTAYGRAVLVKIVLLGVLIGLGALNRQRTLPRIAALARAGETARHPAVILRRALQAEVGVIAVVIVVSGALSGYTPAKDAFSRAAHVTVALEPQRLQLTVDPGKVGANMLDLYLLDRGRAPSATVRTT